MIREFLARKLAGGRLLIGQAVCFGDFRIRHADDEGRDPATLEIFRDPADAIRIATWTDDGGYRPLKSAPNLRHGWELHAGSLDGLRLALDYLYPAALGNALAVESGEAIACQLRDTLGRQTGMYAVTKKITDDEADKLIRSACDDTSRCLKKIIWPVGPGRPSPLTHAKVDFPDGVVPLICAEACSLLVAGARSVVKSRPSPTASAVS